MCSSLNYLFLKEEMDPYDNSPEPLVVLSAKKIIKDQISIDGLRLPREVAHLLSRQFRHHMLNRVTLTIETELCEQFFRQFKPEYISLSYVDFSKLPITDKFLVEFVKRYRTTLTHLNISSCNKLTPVCFIKLNEILSEQHDGTRRVRGSCTSTRKLAQTRKKARALRNYESSMAAANARYCTDFHPRRRSSSSSSSYHNYANKPYHQPHTPYNRPRLPQTIYEQVYAGNGLVVTVPAKPPYYQGARPMRYITDFGRPNNIRDLNLDYDRHDFEDDEYNYDEDDDEDDDGDDDDDDDDDEFDLYANKEDEDDADDEDDKGDEDNGENNNRDDEQQTELQKYHRHHNVDLDAPEELQIFDNVCENLSVHHMDVEPAREAYVDDENNYEDDETGNNNQAIETVDKKLCLQLSQAASSSKSAAISIKHPNVDINNGNNRASSSSGGHIQNNRNNDGNNPNRLANLSATSSPSLPACSSRSFQGRDQQPTSSSVIKNLSASYLASKNILKLSDKNHDIKEDNEQIVIDQGSPRYYTTKIARVSNYVAKKAPNNLKTLILGETISKILPGHPDPIESALSSHLALRKLVAHKIIDEDFICGGVINHLITQKMHNTLRYLDLSNSIIKEGSSLINLTSLRTLILYNCDMTYPQIVTNICQLKSLTVLDVSQVKPTESNKDNFKGALKRIVTELPELTSLDISGTQLVSRKDPEISGLKARQDNPFEFLGLFHTEEDASYRTQIPAISIAGDANESQILTACEAYIKRPEQLTKALNDLFVIFRIKHEFDEIITRALHIVLVALHEHLDDEHVQRAGTASLCCLSRTHEVIHNFNLKIKKLIVSRLLDAMHRHKHCQQILQNGSLIFIHLIVVFKTQAWMDECYRLAAISLHIINTNFNDEGSMQRHGVAVLNSLACQVGGEQKIIMAELDAIVHMVRLIRQKLAENRCDDVLEAAWSTMWNITDESPINCQKFLGEQGLAAFEQCMDKFPENKDLIRNIMGLLGNVAECGELRHHFMEEKYMNRFTKLLNSTDMIECSYNACGILAHLMSDGQEFWDRYLSHSSRQRVLELMRVAISSWQVCQARSINYRSFVPIIKLLKPSLPPEVQYWAVWALTNLTRVYPNKYCTRLYQDGGHESLELLIKSNTAPYVKRLAMVTLYQCEWFDSSTDGTFQGFETCDSIDLDYIRKFRIQASLRERRVFPEHLFSGGSMEQYIRGRHERLQEEERNFEEDFRD